MLISHEMTEEFSLDGDLVGIFYDREGIFSKVVISYFLIGDVDDEDGTADSFQLRTFDKTEEECDAIFKMAKANFDDFEKPFIDWSIADRELNFRILSCGVSYFSSQKIMSKKHMLEAHKMLDADELLVSIPRRGLIFVCDRNLSQEDYSTFLNIHGSIVMQDNELEYLCEDLFILKEGELSGSIRVQELTDMLNQKYKDAVVAVGVSEQANDRIKREITAFKSNPDYLEIIARDHLNLCKEGETIIRILR